MRLLNENLCFAKGTSPEVTLEVSGRCVFEFHADGNEAITTLRSDGDRTAVFCLGALDAGLYHFTARDDNDEICEHLTVYDRQYQLPPFPENSIMYHVFVDRFFRGSVCVPRRADAVYAGDWYDTPLEYPQKPGDFIKNNNFYGGTLYGVTEKLDYLCSLGVNIIYLSPVFEAYSNHKYDTGDYLRVDAGFGGDEALAELFSRAKERSITVILDGVFNHTGDNSRYFDRYGNYGGSGAYGNPGSRYREWYHFGKTDDEYDCWWGIRVLPKVVPCRSYIDFICETVIPKYMKLGAGGFRLDVVDELEPEFVEKIANVVKSYGGYLVGEVWEDASDKIAYGKRRRYFQGRQLDGVMNYPLRDGIIDFLVWKSSSKLKSVYRSLKLHYPTECLDYSMTLLGTHDTERIFTVLGGEFSGGHSNSELAVMRMTREQYEFGKRLLKCAFALQYSLCGIPSIYYGDEVGMQGYRDPFNRCTFPWGREDGEILEWVRMLGALRRRGEIGGRAADILDSDDKMLVCRSGRSIVAVNMDSKPREVRTGTNCAAVQVNAYDCFIFPEEN